MVIVELWTSQAKFWASLQNLDWPRTILLHLFSLLPVENVYAVNAEMFRR